MAKRQRGQAETGEEPQTKKSKAAIYKQQSRERQTSEQREAEKIRNRAEAKKYREKVKAKKQKEADPEPGPSGSNAQEEHSVQVETRAASQEPCLQYAAVSIQVDTGAASQEPHRQYAAVSVQVDTGAASQEPHRQYAAVSVQVDTGAALQEPHRQYAAASIQADSLPEFSDTEHPDLVAGVLGTQVHKKAEVVQWKDGPKTILPYLPGKRSGKSYNIVSKEKRYVETLANIPECMVSNDLVTFLSRSLPRKELLAGIREALSQGKTVVVKGFVDTNGFELTEEGLYEEFGCFPDRTVVAHDMKMRALDQEHPHVYLTVRELLQGIERPGESRMALDFPLSESSLPPPIEKLDDGLQVGFNQTHKIVDVADKNLPPDVFTARSWGLLHQAGIFTAPHHDAEGWSTFAIPWSGCKIWVCMRVKDSTMQRKELAELLAKLAHKRNLPTEYEGMVDVQTIYAYPGDLIMMPPGQMHTVYTPVAGFCRGGHFHNYDTMHLAELSRYIDSLKGKYITNEENKGTLEIFSRMVLALPIISGSRKLYKRSVAALCGMVLYEAEYQAEEAERQKSECQEAASDVAKEVLESFGIKDKSAYLDFITDTGVEPTWRGEEVKIFELLRKFRKR